MLCALVACTHDEPPAKQVDIAEPVTPLPSASATATVSASATAMPSENETRNPYTKDPIPIPSAEKTIAALRPAFRTCYNQGLRVDPKQSGRIVVMLKVAPDGHVVDSVKAGGSGLSVDVEQCIITAARKAVFDAPGAATTLTVPINFVTPSP